MEQGKLIRIKARMHSDEDIIAINKALERFLEDIQEHYTSIEQSDWERV